MASQDREASIAGEIERRYGLIREAAERDGLDAVLVCASEYTGFEGAMFYVSGFRILHRYAYVLLPLEEPPTNIFPGEGRWVGDHAEGWVADRVFAETPGKWIAQRIRERGWKRVGVYGMDLVMTVRDYVELPHENVVRWDEGFDLARAVKSQQELASVRDSVAINEAGVLAVVDAWEPGKTEAELMAVAEQTFVSHGTRRLTMDMVLTGRDGAALPEMRLPDEKRRIAEGDMLIYGLEVAGPGGHWVEVSRPICGGRPSDESQRMMEAYREYHRICATAMHHGATAREVHRAVAAPFLERGWKLGHVTGHSIGMTMIEHPRIGDAFDVELREDMVCSMHPHVISEDERTCLYFQDTWHVQRDGAVALSRLPVDIIDPREGVLQREAA
ncbi:MAG: aminopeptidase P family protein [Solirubrobacterales bacterium]|nr:aminopeptidase P family protein [Solirubrobacterales bacterium]